MTDLLLQRDGTFSTETSIVPANRLPGSAIVAPIFSGICGTDLAIRAGAMDDRVAYPHILGHEAVARVVDCAEDAGFRPGELVSILPYVPCGTCALCRASRSNICREMDFIGIDVVGALQENLSLPTSCLFAVPTGVTPELACLAEPLAVAMHDVSIANVSAEDDVIVIGGGPIGYLVAEVARHAGAAVRIVEIGAWRRAFLDSRGFESLKSVQELGISRARVVFEVTGHPEGFSAAQQVVGPAGTICVVGIQKEHVEVDLKRVFFEERRILGARLYTREDFKSALEALAINQFDLSAMITATLPITRADEAFDQLSTGRSMKVLLEV